ncbi:hypothetical protein [Spirosoma endbachense]|uniref:Uncharacterized protein n=1 Tax=Spirosoma endbachense TaxID=2666025 RepID=A0A6P1W0P8_9BACT|nr:hypothetical protein [Spirosoma endbachense]QHV97872.1 hypothetical protein GJR95_23960 [Spirosoma endbachense]
MKTCTSIAHPLLRPTPSIASPLECRWVQLTFCEIEFIIGLLSVSLQDLISGKLKPQNQFPLTSLECLALIETLSGQLPALEPKPCCTDLLVRLPELQLYQFNQYRFWVENDYAETLERLDKQPEHWVGQQVTAQTTRNYTLLTRIKKKLSSPIVPWTPP